MNDHSKRDLEKEQQGAVRKIRDDPDIKGARTLYLRSHVSQIKNRKRGGQVVVLNDIAQDEPDRTTKKGNPNDINYTVVRKYLYRDKHGEKITFNLSLLIPRDMEVEEVLAHKGGNLTHFRIQFGDILVFIYSEESPKPGDYIEGLAEIKVSKSQRLNIGHEYILYPYINLFVGYGEDLPGFSVKFDLTKREVPYGSIDFSPSSKGIIIHLDPIDNTLSPGITITRKSR